MAQEKRAANDPSGGETQAFPNGSAEASHPNGKSAGEGGLLANHGGKLAVGVAAMLGLAIFYKWREQEVSSEDPDESAGFKRIKAIVESDEIAPSARETGRS